MATGALWKVEDSRYFLQFNSVKPREKAVLFDLLKDWNKTGSGYHKDGTELLIFSKNVEGDIYKFVKQLPFPLIEEKKSGQSIKIKTAWTPGEKILKKNFNKKEKTKAASKEAGTRICSLCGDSGHNRRTCGKR